MFLKILNFVDASYRIYNFSCSSTNPEIFEFNICSTDETVVNVTFTIKKPIHKFYVGQKYIIRNLF